MAASDAASKGAGCVRLMSQGLQGLVRELLSRIRPWSRPIGFARQFVFLFGLGFAMNIGLAPAHRAGRDFFLDEDP